MKEREVKIIQVLNADINIVWDAWTNPDSMKQWLSPENMTTPDAEVDLKNGGEYKIVMNGQDLSNPQHNGKMTVGGRYIEIKKPRKLVFTWLWQGSPVDTHTTTITLEFKKLGYNKTEMTITHIGFADDHIESMHNEGWVSTFRKLEKFLSG